MITRTVNIHATYDDGTIAANVLVNAILSHADLDPNDGWISPQNNSVATDANGDASLDLWPDERGVHGSRYRVWAIDDTGNYVFDVWANVPDTAGPHQLADISEPVESGSGRVGGTLSTAQVEALVNDLIDSHKNATNPHPQYATGGNQDTHSGRNDNPHGVTASQAGADPEGSADAAESSAKSYTDQHANDTGNPHQVTAEQAGADPSGTAVSEVNSHEAATNPHPQYATGGNQDTHSGRTDNPHNVTAEQAGADPAGTAASEISAHEGKTDPHTQYAERDENLADLGNAGDARTNLGLGGAATQDEADLLAKPPIVVDTNITLGAEHNGQTLRIEAGVDITIPSNASEGLAEGFNCDFQKATTDNVAFLEGSNSVTIEDPEGTKSMGAQYSWRAIKKMKADTWSLV